MTRKEKTLKIADLRRKLKRINVLVKILEKRWTKEVYSKTTRRYHYITEYVVGDETGIISLVVWNESKNLKLGETYLLENVDVILYKSIPKIIVRDDSIATIASENIAFSEINKTYRTRKERY